MRLYGVAEVADALGVPQQYVSKWLLRGSHDIPAPDARLRATPVWYSTTIEPWIEERRGR